MPLQKDLPSHQTRSPRLSPRKKEKKEDRFLQGRLEDFRSELLTFQLSATDDTDNIYSTEHSADPSPRRLPELPTILTREQFLHQNPDTITSYHDVAASTSERDEDEASGMSICQWSGILCLIIILLNI